MTWRAGQESHEDDMHEFCAKEECVGYTQDEWETYKLYCARESAKDATFVPPEFEQWLEMTRKT